MAGIIKKLERSEGVTVTAPTDLAFTGSMDRFAQYASDAAYVTAKGSAAADGDAYYNTATDTVRVYSAGVWGAVAGGGGGINYITQSTFTVFKDTAGLMPTGTFGLGASITCASHTVGTILRGTEDLIITKGAGNYQGEGVYWPFNIDYADTKKVLTISFDYLASGDFNFGSGTAAVPSDLTVYIYDVLADNIIQPYNYQFDGGGRFVGQFQASGYNQYRLIVFISKTTAEYWTCQVDNISVGPQTAAISQIDTDWAPFTPTLTNFTASATNGRWRRNSQDILVEVQATLNAAPTGTMIVSLPTNAPIDTTIFYSGTYNTLDGQARCLDISPSGSHVAFILQYSSSTSQVVISGDDGTDLWNASNPIAWANGDIISLKFRYPVVGWGSNVIVSSKNDGRVTALRATLSADRLLAASPETIIFNQIEEQTHSNFDNTTGVFTAVISGYHFISYGAIVTVGAATTTMSAGIFKNNTGSSYGAFYTSTLTALKKQTMSGYSLLWLNAGDNIRVKVYYDGGVFTIDGSGGEDDTYLNIFAIGSGQQIAASEVVAAKYYESSATTAISTLAVFDFDTMVIDTHGACSMSGANTFKFSAPIAGVYSASVQVPVKDSAWAATEYVIVYIYKNSNKIAAGMWTAMASGNFTNIIDASTIAQLNVGDTIEVRIETNGGAAVVNGASEYEANFSIHRIGGVM